MKTVREHMKAAGFDPAVAWNAGDIEKRGTMKCESISIRRWKCRPDCGEMMVAVEATANVPFTDGTLCPYPMGWPNSLEASITAYFPMEKEV